MSIIRSLDCTLRDGGYCNNWEFGKENIAKIVNALVESNIDVIECGYISEKHINNSDRSIFTSFDAVDKIIPFHKNNSEIVAMINFGEFSCDNIPNKNTTKLDGIRVAFHKKNIDEALQYCKIVKEKGFKLYVQPMVSLNYSDEEFIRLIKEVNKIHPEVFYIVDSFGVMKRKDLTRLFYMVEHNLDESIMIGYHSHNNMQLAYSNAQSLVNIRTNRNLIIDSSTYGMGRGAGNLNTELFVEYLNDSIGANYALKPILTIIDEVLTPFYQKNYWGYSLSNYLSAKYNSHPNYASYLEDKKTLTYEAMDEIFSLMDDEKRFSFDKDYIEKLYTRYLENGKAQEEHLSDFKRMISGKTVLVIAPGKSSVDEKEKILDFAKQDGIITFSVNFNYPELDTEYIFLSNLRRYRELDKSKKEICITTSNIPSVDAYIKTKYSDLLNTEDAVHDNAGLMMIKFLINLDVKKVYLAGMDGYSTDPSMNYGNERMILYSNKSKYEAINEGLNNVLNEYSKKIEIEFLTKPRYVRIKEA